MSQANRVVLAQALKEVSLEAAGLYSDEPLDYKGRPVTPRTVLGAGDNSHYVDVIVATLENSHGRKILDVGIAYGIYDIVLQRRFGFEVHGIDHPENVPAYCRFPMQEGIPVIPCDLHHDVIPYRENTFDTVIASEIVEHLLLPPKAFFANLHPVLKPGGKLIITTPNFASLRNILSLIKGDNPTDTFPEKPLAFDKTARDRRVHPREYTVSEIVSSLLPAGFEVDSIQTKINQITTKLSLKWRLVKALMRITPKHRDKIIAVGTKTVIST